MARATAARRRCGAECCLGADPGDRRRVPGSQYKTWPSSRVFDVTPPRDFCRSETSTVPPSRGTQTIHGPSWRRSGRGWSRPFPAHLSEPEVAAAFAGHTTGHLIGDRNWRSLLLTDAWAADVVCLLAPCATPARIRIRGVAATSAAFGAALRRPSACPPSGGQVKRVRARDLWHLLSRLICKVLSHAVAHLRNNRALGKPPRQVAQPFA